MPTPGTTDQEPSSGYERLESQIRWYDQKSRDAQWYHKWVKFAEVVCAVLIPFAAKIEGTVTALLGATVVLLEYLQQSNQWSQNWITYRSTCEALRHEKYTYMGKAGVYAGLDDAAARGVLVERVESLVSTEHAKWISRQEYDAEKAKKPKA